MAHVITFQSKSFDVTRERPNPVNPIAGESVLKWLGEKLQAMGYTTTAPDTEDWGWYIDVSREGVHYLVGASAEPEPAGGPVEWTLQIHRHRSLKDKLTGRNKLGRDDALAAIVERLIRDDGGTSTLEVQTEA